MNSIISQTAINHHLHWIDEIVKLSGHFGLDVIPSFHKNTKALNA